MDDLMKRKLGGLKADLAAFAREVEDFALTHYTMQDFKSLLVARLKALGFDAIKIDRAGNIVAVVKGYGKSDHMVTLAHLDLVPGNDPNAVTAFNSNMLKFKSGLISSVFAGALLKRSLLPLKGDFVVALVPRIECCDFNVKYLFDETLKGRRPKIRGVLLNEPTGFNVNLGHKGRMEYEIVVKTRTVSSFMASRGVNMLGAMFPLINELERHGKTLPSDAALGASALKIKDVRYGAGGPPEQYNEFRVIVDREFVPEEDERRILDRAEEIARRVYRDDAAVSISAALAKEKITTYTGLEVVSQKEFRPWTMGADAPFVLKSMGVLRENGFNSSTGYWRQIITEGSYTCGELKLPTIGFGAGEETQVGSNLESLSLEMIEKAVLGQALIAHRNIGMPAFGWTSDEI